MATVNELVTMLGFSLSPNAGATIGRYKQSLQGIYETAQQVGLAAKEAAEGLYTTTEAAKTMETWSKATNMSIEDLQRWQRVAAESGQKANKLFAVLAEWRKNPLATKSTIFEWADTLKAASHAERQALAAKLGIQDQELIDLFAQGSEKIKAIMDKAIVIDSDIVEKSARTHDNAVAIMESAEKSRQQVFMSITAWAKEGSEQLKEYLETAEGQKKAFQAQTLGGAILGTKGITVAAKLAGLGKSILGAIMAHFGIGGGVATAGAGGATAGAGGAAAGGGFFSSVMAAAIFKSIYDEAGFAYDLSKKGVSKTLDEYRNFEGGMDWVNFAKISVLAADEIMDRLGYQDQYTQVGKLPTTIQDNKTINVYVTTPSEIKDVIDNFSDYQPTTPGGFSPIVN